MLASVLNEIDRRRRFLVTAHARPDGDAIGSTLACGAILRQLGKQADLILADRIPLIYETLPGARSVRCAQAIDGEYDAVIILECDGIPRTRLQGLDGRFLINIDHHESGRAFANVNWIDPAACAVGEMIYDLAKASGIQITPEIATCLYTAVVTDTGLFAYEGTDAHTFRLAAALVELGAQPARIAQDVYFTNPTSKMRLLGAALTNLRREGRISWMWVTQDDLSAAGAAEEDCEGLVNYAVGIAGVDVSVFLRELPDHRMRLSLRSKGGTLNVATIAQNFGGGGHENAAGCTLDGPLNASLDLILTTLRNHLAHATKSGSRSQSVTI
jgi:bifunctional oligoribonuclease and PAP phosphatase NrnA